MQLTEIVAWLREDRPERLAELWAAADQVRKDQVGDAVHLRGLVELSSHCVQRCRYCGIAATRQGIPRYRLSDTEVLACAADAQRLGYGTLVMQAGEDPGIAAEPLADLIRRIKDTTPLAVTLSLGERTPDELRCWREAGADRYLLRFETSRRDLYARIHPGVPGRHSDRFATLATLRELGYELGSGVMIGLPGQRYLDLARDLLTFRELGLEMIGVGPFLPHPETPLGEEVLSGTAPWASPDEQVPASEELTYKVVALTRLLCPTANIPSTTALATLNQEGGRELGLQRGANVVMPNLTPARYRRLYEIYPAKACLAEEPGRFHAQLVARIHELGRTVGQGPGSARRGAGVAQPGTNAGAAADPSPGPKG
ncbi:MAG: [FeFe] hydrogenase H-cluster radical SAM maturase HydE [Myxococcota bacterium]|nr:[FeFe] hydrogenase H-cluster radical SAM maturase HydE [Myxococcota bacterium]